MTPQKSQSQAISTSPAVITVVSDVVCPWCFIGKRRLEKALALLGCKDVEIAWAPFELNPDVPKEGMDRRKHRIRKFGSLAYAKQLEDRVAAAGEGEGIDFHFAKIKRIPNTFDAHRLLWFARQNGLQNTLAENLFRAYFLNGEDIGQHEILKRIATESGVEAQSVDNLLESDLGVREVLAEEDRSRQFGVNGVPTFFVNGAPVTSGAQDPQLLATLLAQRFDATAQCSVDDKACD